MLIHAAFVRLFILKLLSLSITNVYSYLRRHYGASMMKLFGESVKIRLQLPRSTNLVHIVPNLMKSYEILQENRKGCASCNIVQESCGILFNLTVRSYIKSNLYDFL